MGVQRMVVGEIIEVKGAKQDVRIDGQIKFKQEGVYSDYDLPASLEVRAFELAGQKVKVTLCDTGSWDRDRVTAIDAVKPTSRKA